MKVCSGLFIVFFSVFPCLEACYKESQYGIYRKIGIC